MLLPDLLADAARRRPDKLAAVFPDGVATFAELDRQSLAVAHHLRSAGIGPSSRVAILYDNTLAGLVYYWGILRSGACAVDVPATAAPATVAEALKEARPKALAAEPRLLERMLGAGLPACPEVVLTTAEAWGSPALRAAGRSLVPLETILSAEPAARPPSRPAPSSVAMCLYTSGTTGRPKGVMLTHDNLLSNVRAFNSRIGLTEDDSLLLVAPLHYIHGRIQLLTYTMLAGTVFFSAGFRFPRTVVQELARYGVTSLSGVPYHFSMLLTHGGLGATPLPRLRHLVITGGALAPERLAQLQAAVPGAALHLNYGLTEASPRLTYHGPSSEVFARPASCGRPLPGVTLEILDDHDRPLPPGVVGEVVAGGPGIMKGYVSGDEVASGRLDARGRLRTGDLGYLDAEGYLFLSGRASDMIKTAGERLFPLEVERVLQTHPAVGESAVFGVPDPVLGERVVACVVPAPGRAPSAQDLQSHCLKSLPYPRVPKEFHVVAELPKTPSGKIRRDALRRRFAPDGVEAECAVVAGARDESLA